MQGLVYNCGGVYVSPSCVTMDKSLESQSIPQTAKPGLGEISFSLEAWKRGFICLGLRSLSCSRFPGLCFGEGCLEGWRVALCLSGRWKGRCLSDCGRWWC